ncbi:DoxX family protein [Sulfurovum sp.]|uniref:DoxX family protein n=1 Tax=Sulfurovum sp. TaxID=1969726 RepID=UPI0025CF137A|nr:DoxX family protein [Sulfurovum sp.]
MQSKIYKQSLNCKQQQFFPPNIELIDLTLLTLDFFTGLISIPLLIIMIVAISTVHLANGFATGNNGFELPLYYMLYLAIFASLEAGKPSLDHLLFGDEQ